MASLSLLRDFDCAYGIAEPVSPLIRRIVARNASPYTFKGTGTYVVGHGTVAVIDPGPDLPEHVDALLDALRGETVSHILVTHTHHDHSPAAAALRRATGAPTVAFGPHGIGSAFEIGGSEEGADRDFAPDLTIGDGEAISGPGWHITAVHTPGHTSNHLCFALAEEKTLFSGDHVMGWSTSVISPPDGNMTDYLRSLDKLLPREDAIYRPTHGPAITEPQRHVQSFIAHRRERRAAILHHLGAGETTIPEIVAAVYPGLDPRLRNAAARSALAHVFELLGEQRVVCDGPPSLTTRYRLAGG
jgi:glyoxylase-like metal-dependent hydrolase (beta-lactamase superfamily II)